MLELLSLNILFNILLYAIIGALGAFAKEVYTYSKKKEILSWNQLDKKSMILGGLLTGFTMPSLEIYLIEKIHVELLLLISFIIGVLSMELFNNISTLANLRKAYKELKDMKDMVTKLKIDQKTIEEKSEGEISNDD